MLEQERLAIVLLPLPILYWSKVEAIPYSFAEISVDWNFLPTEDLPLKEAELFELYRLARLDQRRQRSRE